MQTTFNITDYSELTANTGVVNIATGNSNLNGSGARTDLITGAAHGTIINSFIIKATMTTTQGMIRFFLTDGVSVQLLIEVPVPASVPSAVQPSFETRVPCSINLAPGNIISVSTQNSESFNIIAEGLDWQYPDTPSCCDHMRRLANNGLDKVFDANPHLDGSGSIVNILTAGNNGSTLESVHIKGQGSTTEGMIRLFISNDGGVTYFLFTEFQIPASTRTTIVPSTINFSQYYSLIFQSSYIIAASTENAETFSIIMNSLDWAY